MMNNILTIDVEDYFQVENFKEYINYNDWSNFEQRVKRNIIKILNILDTFNYKATFFILGWTAERNSEVVKEIYNRGHEVATHGYSHELIYKQSENEFKEDIIRSIEVIEGIIKDKIIGYRAPAFSITKDSFWALDIIKEVGLKYDASIFPIQGHDRYGMVDAKPQIYNLDNDLFEVPPATVKIFGKRLPIAGGGYFRLAPYILTKIAIKKINNKEMPAVIYLHPWEFDPDQPRIEEANYIEKFRHYINIDKTEDKFKKMLSDFNFTSIENYLELNEVENNV